MTYHPNGLLGSQPIRLTDYKTCQAAGLSQLPD